MKKKILIIVTRQLGKEFQPYWQISGNNTTRCFDDKTSYTVPLTKDSDNYLTTILNGEDFGKEDGNFGQMVKDILTKEDLYKSLKNEGEVGILSHGGANNPNVEILKTDGINVVFNQKYSSSDNGSFCQYINDTFVSPTAAPNPPRTGVFDAFRDVFVFNEIDKLPEAFKNLWSYFSIQPLVEAKLKLLHNCMEFRECPPVLEVSLSAYQDHYNKFIEAVNGRNISDDDRVFITELTKLRVDLLGS